ncbi:hypothetical protein [uncultured Parabacteroides sp.]|uniref:hypothetical protein n=1 Tax=uncultured Parabacteroides sp. TaxID=512312 RepID=UPI0025FADAD6|nr:hypothetical protein [uncultured Parabacteroides sp.]
MNAGQLNQAAQLLGDDCEELDSVLRKVMKHNNSLRRLLQNAVWEEDMVKEELIVLTMPTSTFLALLGPLLESRGWTVNGRHEIRPFLRAFLSVFRLRTDLDKDFLTMGTIENLVLDYLYVYHKLQ